MSVLTNDERVALWDAINRYVQTCGGDPSQHVYGNAPRMDAVVAVERAVATAVQNALSRPQPSEPGGEVSRSDAEALRAAKEAAWDEGARAAIVRAEPLHIVMKHNPHRDRSTKP